jgi:hypothetical protein
LDRPGWLGEEAKMAGDHHALNELQGALEDIED